MLARNLRSVTLLSPQTAKSARRLGRFPQAWVSVLLAALALGACSAESTNGNGGFADGFILPDVAGGDGSGATDDSATDTEGDTAGGGDAGGNSDSTVIGPGSDTGGGNPGAKFQGYPSQELRVRIVGPSGRGHAVVSSGVIELAGVLFGQADSITVSTDGGFSGEAVGAPFFQSIPVTLNQGDNVITVTAKNATEEVSDTLIVTYNPSFQFQDRIRVAPSIIKTGKQANVRVVLALGKASNIVANTIKLQRVDEQGNVLTSFTPPVDNGDLASSGDEIAGDGLYSSKIKLTEAQAATVRLRGQVQVKIGTQTMTAFTDIAKVDAVDQVTGAECAEVLGALNDAKAAGDAAAMLAALQANGAVAEAGLSPVGGGVWARFNSGLLGAIPSGAEGNRSGEGSGSDTPEDAAQSGAFDPNFAISTLEIQAKRALLLDPGKQALGQTEVAETAAMLAQEQCPAYDVVSKASDAATLNYYRQMYEFGVIANAGHGDVYFGEMNKQAKQDLGWQHLGSQEVLWTGNKVQCQGYFGSAGAPAKTCSESVACPAEQECILTGQGSGECVDHLTADLRKGRVIIGADGTFGITPAFVSRHATDTYARSLVYLGSCRSLWNGSLAGEFIAAGATAVAGFSGLVRNEFATQWGKTFFSNLITQKQKTGVAHVTIEDSGNPGSYFRMVGAQNLDISRGDLINPSWETGNLQGWSKAGDGRVIARLGSTVPVGGKFMGIISTGLGYTTQTGEISQRFCIPAGKSKVSFWWKYYSEEFKEYCGSTYQDAFDAKVEAKIGNKTIVSYKVDDICPGGKAGVSLTQSDVDFDQGDNWTTPWVKGEAVITPFSGNGNVKLRFYASDVGDSIYDTAVLIDKIEID
jgi:hypothetical protein